ncbi:MAG: alpha/beta hydrolase [Candidatus Staskawiczbacteria bacterium]|jgi:pimeloyl-ACP methyl ester carboxylesterase
MAQNLIILHGWQSSKEKWQAIKEEIEKKGIRVIAPDLPGFKEGTRLSKPWTFDDYIAWLTNFISSENLSEPFFLLGHSFGGALAAKYALQNPSRVGKLFLVAASCVRRKTLKRRVLAYFSKFIKKFSFLPLYSLFRKATYKFIIRNSDYIHAEGFLEDTYLNVIKEDLSPVLHSIHVPTVIIWGDKDDTTPIRDGRFISKEIANSKFELIHGADHRLNTKNPDELVKIVLRNI